MIFEGFPPEAFIFFKDLKKNNNKTWFDGHKSIYENCVKEPMIRFIMNMGEELYKFAPQFIADPRANGSLYRIYRDTRFSNNKEPYKTHAAANFWHGGGTKHNCAGYYFHFDDAEYMIAGGIYMPETQNLNRIRRYIASRPEEFRDIISHKQFRKDFGEIRGESLSRPPKGFPKDHPMIQYLKMKQYLVYIEGKVKKETFLSPKIFEQTVRLFKSMTQLIAFLNRGIGLEHD